MVISQGDVYWIDLGLPHGSEPGLFRPYVVVQNDIVNRSRLATVLVCSITSNLRLAEARGNVFLEAGEANLPKPSVVVVSQIATVDKSRLTRKLGSLSSVSICSILDGIRLITEPLDVG